MKNRLLRLVKKAVAPVALVAAMAAFSPVPVMAANRGGGFSGGHAGGFSGGHSYAAPSRENFGGRSFSAPRGNFSGNFNRGNAYGGAYFGGRGYYGGRGYGPGFGFGVGVYPSYGFSAPVCGPAGFYDRFGVWHFYPGCAVPY